ADNQRLRVVQARVMCSLLEGARIERLELGGDPRRRGLVAAYDPLARPLTQSPMAEREERPGGDRPREAQRRRPRRPRAQKARAPRASCARATGPEASPDRTAIACTARGELELVRRRLEPLARPMSAHDHGGAACGELEHALEQGAAGQAVDAGEGLIEQQQP